MTRCLVPNPLSPNRRHRCRDVVKSSAQHGAYARKSTLRCADSLRRPLPITCGERQEALSHAWRSKGFGRAKGESERL